MNIGVATTKTIVLKLSEEEAEMLKAFVQNPPTSASAEVRVFLSSLFAALREALL
jgi:hypothetical protein